MRDLRGIISPNQEIGQAGPGKTTHPQRPTARLNSRGMPSDSESSAEPDSLHSWMHLVQCGDQDAFVRQPGSVPTPLEVARALPGDEGYGDNLGGEHCPKPRT